MKNFTSNKFDVKCSPSSPGFAGGPYAPPFNAATRAVISS